MSEKKPIFLKVTTEADEVVYVNVEHITAITPTTVWLHGDHSSIRIDRNEYDLLATILRNYEWTA